MNSIHGHLLLEMLLDGHKDYTRESLKLDIERRFGSEAMFHACAAKNLNFEGMLNYLFQRGKIFDNQGVLKTKQSLICDHE